MENLNTEYKELDRRTGALPDSLSKEIVAFANTEGGELYVGIANDGTVIGVNDPDDTMTRISNTLHDTILPDIMPFVQIRGIEREGKNVILITVNVGTERPYYLAKFGLKPTGVFRRVGTSCLPVSEAGIREMIMDTSGKSFEESRCMNQDLSFTVFEKEMTERHLEYAREQLRTLKLIGEDGLYTNLALLLSDQCPFSIKIAVFQGADNAIFRDRKEFEGSILKQLSDAYEMLDRYNGTRADFNGLRREDRRDYPEDALREALLNSIVHRDYLFSGSIIINLFDDHIEFISLGGLIRGLSLQAIFMGASQSRNPNLAALFYRLKLVESYGTGVRKIIRLYQGFDRKPEFRTAEGAFTVIMYNRNEGAADNVSIDNVAGQTKAEDLPAQEVKQLIFDYVLARGSVTRKEIQQEFDIGSTTAFNILKALCAQGVLKQMKMGRNTVYKKL